MEVKVLSREIIKPSSSLPPHPRSFNLSLLDQFSNVSYIPIVYFYHLNNKDGFDPKDAVSKLKSSLSETLSRFYPLAGRIRDRSIDCNDEGAVFLEASIDCSMYDILKEPHYETLSNLLPCSPVCTKPVEEYPQIVAQFNTFSCGGVAISICFLHKLIDTATMSCLLQSWTSIIKASSAASSDSFSEVVCADYNEVSSLFPQMEFLPFHQGYHMLTNPEQRNCVERFVFNAKAVSELKEKAKSIDVLNPTSVEVVTGFIWKHAMEAASLKLGYEKPCIASHAVNLRKRMEPPLPEFSIGNILWLSISQYENDKADPTELHELVSLLRNSFAEIDNSYIQKLTRQGDNNGGLGAISVIREWAKQHICKKPNSLMFSSWRNMKMNDVDFGWGKPIWTSFAAPPNLRPYNITFLLETVSGDGIEAWMLHDEEEMKLLKQNLEFLEFALINPSISLPEKK